MSRNVLVSDDHEARMILTSELEAGETLHWAGKPRPGVFLRAHDIFLIPFSLMWGGFAIFWEVGVVTQGAPWFFMLWGIPFVVIGLYMIAGRFFVDAWIRARTYYGVTDRRVIIHRRTMRTETKSHELSRLPALSLKEYGNGRATIQIGEAAPGKRYYEGMPWPGTKSGSVSALEQILDGKEVLRFLREES